MAFSDNDDICKTSNADLDFEDLPSNSQYLDLSKFKDFVIKEIPKGKLLALIINMRLLVNVANFSKLEALLLFMTYKLEIILFQSFVKIYQVVSLFRTLGFVPKSEEQYSMSKTQLGFMF